MKIILTKITVTAFVLLSLIFSSAPAEEAKKIKIFILSGQSNMTKGEQQLLPRSPYDKPLHNVMYREVEENRSDKSDPKLNEWASLPPAQNKKGFKYVVELSFAHHLSEIFPDENLRFIKSAMSGTGLATDWDPKSKGPQYVKLIAGINKLKEELTAANIKYEIAGMVWLQGKNDSKTKEHAEAYEENLTYFINHLREIFVAPEMVFVIAQTVANKPFRDQVQAAQIKVGETIKNCGWVPTTGLDMSDGAHFATEGR